MFARLVWKLLKWQLNRGDKVGALNGQGWDMGMVHGWLVHTGKLGVIWEVYIKRVGRHPDLRVLCATSCLNVADAPEN